MTLFVFSAFIGCSYAETNGVLIKLEVRPVLNETSLRDSFYVEILNIEESTLAGNKVGTTNSLGGAHYEI